MERQRDGERCREVMRDMPVNEKTIAYAKSVRELVVDEIKQGVFDYQRRFPDSAKVTQAGETDQAKSPLPAQPKVAIAAVKSLEPASPTMTVKEGVMLWLRVAKSRTTSTTYLTLKNMFFTPLDTAEVKHTAKSVAKWTFRNFNRGTFEDYIAKTHTSDMQAFRGKQKGKKERKVLFYLNLALAFRTL